MNIRQEQPGDIDKISKVHLAAFETQAEAKLVELLRNANIHLISLVAEEGENIIGHILFSPVTLHESIKVMGLAPMAVLPDWQNRGIGSQLVAEGLKACEKAHYDAVFVLGHAHYYPRFGFVPSVNFGINCEYDVPPEVFMAKEIKPGALANVRGTVKFHPLFNEV